MEVSQMSHPAGQAVLSAASQATLQSQKFKNTCLCPSGVICGLAQQFVV